jgi:hypothetical protein
MLRKRDRSDKAETYRDRFDMVVKIEECLFVSRCHQGRGRNVSGATRYLFRVCQWACQEAPKEPRLGIESVLLQCQLRHRHLLIEMAWGCGFNQSNSRDCVVRRNDRIWIVHVDMFIM